MSKMTGSQLRALRWISDFPSTEAAWTVNGNPIRREPPDKWNSMRISGPQGSILVDAADFEAIGPYVAYCQSPDKLYSVNDAGRLALQEDSK